ncbi:hypothetical protein IE4803_CH02937 [Rhizobium etli bv. phaseoli str. IE4803]|uniref:Uncharacterized protein n=1 Tax=Rhizobium etli bv. mimosae str. IE4771 TaxID=1432050 RepID=A0A060I2M1_RHIET|nr:hypothetical protein [Rhizobium sp. IE4771]AIC28062.1 hypothetical protein IE4771_CH02968 [Rhizobium sp. IE4771]AJC80121.1 hypothetical protein IE4803_CH02937 [Rhizobium etli bv. phaseoli str. IE4803]
MSESVETAFVAELIRAANQIDKLTDHEVKLLLFRAIVTARDLREAVGIPGSGTPEDAVVRLYEIAEDVDQVSPAARTGALLEAAGLIRDLRIVVESGTKLALWQPASDLVT